MAFDDFSGNNFSGNNARKRASNGPQFSSVNNVLASTLRKFGLENDIARYKFVLHWKEIVGEQIAQRTRPECINRDTLIVRVVDSQWAQELAFQKDVITKRLQRFLGDGTVIKDVHFYVGQVEKG